MEKSSTVLMSSIPLMVLLFVIASFIITDTKVDSFSFSKLSSPYVGENSFLPLVILFVAVLDFCFLSLYFLPKMINSNNNILLFSLCEMPVIFGLIVSIISQNGFAIIPYVVLSAVQYLITISKTN